MEGQTGLYVFFKTVCDLYDLLPAENYKLPPEAEGLEAPPPEPEPEMLVPQILKNPSQQRSTGAEEDNVHPGVGRTNTRRHIRSSPSTGSAVTTVVEADEDDTTDGVTRRVRELQISAPETVAEEPEVAEVPVIVEHPTVLLSSTDPETRLEEATDHDGKDLQDDQTVIETEPVASPSEEEEAAPQSTSDELVLDEGDKQDDGTVKATTSTASDAPQPIIGAADSSTILKDKEESEAKKDATASVDVETAVPDSKEA